MALAIVTFAWTTSALAEDNPDANALFEQHQRQYSKAVPGLAPIPIPSFFTNKADFIAGANEVIDAMKNKREVHTTFAGLPAKPPPYIDEQFGIEMRAIGCMINPQSETKSMGRRAALLWYVNRGSYPINSSKPRVPLDKVPKTGWAPLSDNKDLRTEIPGLAGTSLILSHENACTYLKIEPSKLAGHFLQWPWTVPPKEILWSHDDKASKKIWFDLPSPYMEKFNSAELKSSRQFIELDPSTGLVIQTRDSDGNLL